MQRFEQKSLFYSLVSKIHMDLARNLTIINFKQLLWQICIFGENLKLFGKFEFEKFDEFGKFGRRSMMERFPDLLLRVQAAYQTFFETLVPRLTHGGTRSFSLPRWYIKNIFKMQNFEHKLSFFSLVSKIHYLLFSINFLWKYASLVKI